MLVASCADSNGANGPPGALTAPLAAPFTHSLSPCGAHALRCPSKRSTQDGLQVVAYTRKPTVVVMDRGVNDIKAYMRRGQWKEPIHSHNLTEEYIDSRYILLTAADGAEKYHATANTAIRDYDFYF